MSKKTTYIAFSLGAFFVLLAVWIASPVLFKNSSSRSQLAQVASGENFFVTQGGGSSSPQDGSSWSHAWAGTGGIKWGTGAGQLGAGDTLWMAGGTYGAFSIGANGAAGSPITIKRATASFPTAVNSPGWQSSFDSQIIIAVPTCNGCQGIYAAPPNSDYITIDGSVDNGIKFTEAPSGINTYTTIDNQRSGIKITGNGDILEYFEVVGPGAPSSAVGVFAGDNYHYGWKTVGVTIDHCYIHGIDVGLDLGDETNMIVQNCNIGPTFSSGPNHDDSVYIFSGSGTFRYNYVHDYPVEGLYFCSQFPPGPNNWKIYGNIFNNNGNLVNGQSLTFDPSSQTTPIQQYQYGSGWQIFNNTFLNSYMSIRTDSRWPAAFSSAIAGGQVSNNIFWNTTNSFGSMTGTNNLFNTAPVLGSSPINANNQNPFVNMAGGDFHITSATGTIAPRNNGTTLASEFATDKDGNTRGADGAWDIGAYEYSSGGTVTPPPSNTYTLTVTNSGTGSGTVSGGTINCGSSCSTTVNSGTTLALTASPASGSTFTSWGGSCSGTSSTCNVTVNLNANVTANFTAAVSSNPDYTSGLVARYSFDNASNLGNDDSGNGNNGTVAGGLTTIAGKSGTAVNFTSASQNISISKDLIGNSATTICAWVDPTSFGAATVGRGRIMENGSTLFYLEPLTATFSLTGDSVNDVFSANSSVVLNQWTHVCASRTSGITTTMYVNGAVSGTANAANGTASAGGTTYIGNNAALNRGFAGAMDDLRIYNRALSASDVAALYTATNQVVVTPPPVQTIPLMSSLSFQASAGLIQAPFTVSGGLVSQNIQTATISGNGQASYQFTISQAGNYVINAMVNAPDDSSNSFFVNIDSLPSLSNVWNITPTSGVGASTVSWGGATTGGNPAQVFNLTAGVHTLYVYGREVNAALSSFTIAPQTVTPSADTTAPNVSITSPSAGTISGSVTLSANASDPTVANQTNSGVSSVQFLLDGSNIGAAITAAPYFGTWNTVGVANGSHTITAVATDGAGNKTTSAGVTVTVNNIVNVPPVMAAIPAKSVNENATLIFTVSATDGNGDALTYSATNLPVGAAFNAGTQTFSWTPSFAQSGVFTVTFSVSDGKGGTDSKTATITVLNVNRPPVSNAGNNQTVTLPNTATLSGAASFDPDGESLTYLWSQVSGPSTSISNATVVSPTITFTGGAGSYVFKLTVSDGTVQAVSQVTITVIQNMPPDTDGDGVNDVVDACPGTPSALYSVVNTVGCPLPLAKNFTTTNLANVNLNSVASIDISNAYGRISFTAANGPYSLVTNGGLSRFDIDNNVSITGSSVSVNSANLPQLNKGATVVIYNVNISNPRILRDNSVCSGCAIASYTSGTLIFTVPGFSTYTITSTPVQTTPPVSPPVASGVNPTGTFTSSSPTSSAPASSVTTGNGVAITAIAIGSTVQTTSTVNVRSNPNTSAAIKTTANAGTTASIVGGPISANGYVWWQISLSNGTVGWSVAPYLSTGNISSSNTSSAVAVSSQGTAVTTAKVNFRAAPSTIAAIKSTLVKGTSVAVTGSSVAASGYTWAPVKLSNGSAGWVVSAYLSYGGTSVSTSKLTVNGKAQTISKVNLRLTPSISGTILYIAPLGTALTVVGGPISANNYAWWQVKLTDGTLGWMVGNYLAAK